jgi:signal transduction histidine kinase
MQIRSRLTLQFIFVFSLITLIAFSVIYYSSADFRRHELYQRLENKAITSAEIFISVKQIDSTMLRIFDQNQRDKLPFETVSIYDSSNRRIYSNTGGTVFTPEIALFDEVRRSGRTQFHIDNYEYIGVIYKDNLNQFVVFAGAIDIFGNSKLKNLGQTLLILFIGIVSVGALAGWIYAGRALKPLSRVMDEVSRISADNLEARLQPAPSHDEIGRLITTFNTMLERISEAFRIQRLFLSGASHELRNPLTTITSQLQVALMRERSSQEYQELIASLLQDIKNLNRTTIYLLEYARLNYEQQVLLTEVRVDDILWNCSEAILRSNPNYSVQVNFDSLPEDPAALIVRGNEPLLRIAFSNIMDNACKFSPDHACLVKLTVRSAKLTLSFVDHGPGIEQDQLGLIFQPFYRGNSTAESSGHGIGLALTKRILDLHEAAIDVETAPGKGTSVSVILPRRL